MKEFESHQYDPSQLSGRNRRLLYEWRQLEEKLAARQDISLSIIKRNGAGLPTSYLIDYHLRSICGVEHEDRLNEVGVDIGLGTVYTTEQGYLLDYFSRLYWREAAPGILISVTSERLQGKCASIWQTPILICCGA